MLWTSWFNYLVVSIVSLFYLLIFLWWIMPLIHMKTCMGNNLRKICYNLFLQICHFVDEIAFLISLWLCFWYSMPNFLWWFMPLIILMSLHGEQPDDNEWILDIVFLRHSAQIRFLIADVITIDKTNENFRLIYDVKGRFTIHRITADEAKVSCRVAFVVYVLLFLLPACHFTHFFNSIFSFSTSCARLSAFK